MLSDRIFCKQLRALSSPIYWRRIREDRPKNVKFTLEEAMKAQRGSRGIDLLFL